MTDPDPSRTPTQVVTAVTAALAEGDLMTVMANVTRDVSWSVASADRTLAPWFREYRGRAGLAEFFDTLSTVEFARFDLQSVAADGDTVMTWLKVELVAPSGDVVPLDEVQIWTLRDGRVASVLTVLDTAAVGAAGFR